jgi:hypothetical protein
MYEGEEIHTWDSLKDDKWYEVSGSVDVNYSLELLEKKAIADIHKKFKDALLNNNSNKESSKS